MLQETCSSVQSFFERAARRTAAAKVNGAVVCACVTIRLTCVVQSDIFALTELQCLPFSPWVRRKVRPGNWEFGIQGCLQEQTESRIRRG
jgi:hypothetical protein